VADVIKKNRLRLVNFSQRRSPLPFTLVGARIGNGHRHLPGDKIQEALVIIIKLSPWADTRYDEAGELRMPRLRHGKQHRSANWLRPWIDH